MIHTPNSLMMMDGAEKCAVIFLPGFQEMGDRLQNLPFLPYSPEDRDRKSGKTEAGHAPRQMETGFAVRGSGSPPRLSEENHPVRKSASRSPFSAGRKRARKRFFAGSCAITGQRPRPRQKHAHCKLFIIKGNGPSQSPSPPLHREAKEKGAAAGSRRPTGGFRGKWPAVFPRQPTPEVFPTSRPFPFPAKLP